MFVSFINTILKYSNRVILMNLLYRKFVLNCFDDNSINNMCVCVCVRVRVSVYEKHLATIRVLVERYKCAFCEKFEIAAKMD